MKKLIVAALLLACVLTLAGCDEANNTPQSGTATPAPSADEPVAVPTLELTASPSAEGLREDRCGLYLQVLEDLWEVDPGLNGGISILGMDLSDLTHLNDKEREYVAETFADKHGLPYVKGTWEELCDQGHIDRDNLYWEDGLFFRIKTDEDAEWNLPAMKEGDQTPELTAFDAHKWRGGDGAYFFGDCSAQKNEDGIWTYSIGHEAIA